MATPRSRWLATCPSVTRTCRPLFCYAQNARCARKSEVEQCRAFCIQAMNSGTVRQPSRRSCSEISSATQPKGSITERPSRKPPHWIRGEHGCFAQSEAVGSSAPATGVACSWSACHRSSYSSSGSGRLTVIRSSLARSSVKRTFTTSPSRCQMSVSRSGSSSSGSPSLARTVDCVRAHRRSPRGHCSACRCLSVPLHGSRRSTW